MSDMARFSQCYGGRERETIHTERRGIGTYNQKRLWQTKDLIASATLFFFLVYK